ncbi:MAG: FAD-dependent oxidoreductase [Sulfolobaceae archaeon]
MANKKRVLILGAGFAGLTIAHRLRENIPDKADVIVISESDRVYDNTIFPALLTDDVKIENTYFLASQKLPPRGIEFIESKVLEIRPESNEVKTDKGTFDYDYLVVALGGAYEENFNKIKGHENAFMHHTLEGFLGIKKVVEEKDEINAFVGNVMNSPIEGPSYQVAFVLEYLGRKLGKRVTVYLGTQSPKGMFGIVPVDWIPKQVNAYAEKRGIKLIKGVYVKEISRNKVLLSNGNEIDTNLISVLPTLSAPEIAKKAGLTDESGFISVEHPTFRSTKFRNIFAVGDSAKGMIPTKTGRAAMISAENAAATIVKELSGKTLPYYAQGVICMMHAGDYSGMLIFDVNKYVKKIDFRWGSMYKYLKKLYSAMLISSAFSVPYHMALPYYN